MQFQEEYGKVEEYREIFPKETKSTLKSPGET